MREKLLNVGHVSDRRIVHILLRHKGMFHRRFERRVMTDLRGDRGDIRALVLDRCAFLLNLIFRGQIGTQDATLCVRCVTLCVSLNDLLVDARSAVLGIRLAIARILRGLIEYVLCHLTYSLPIEPFRPYL